METVGVDLGDRKRNVKLSTDLRLVWCKLFWGHTAVRVQRRRAQRSSRGADGNGRSRPWRSETQCETFNRFALGLVQAFLGTHSGTRAATTRSTIESRC